MVGAEQTSALLMSYAPRSGAGERNRTVVSALARPHSAVEPHPRGVPNRIDFPSLAIQMPQAEMFAIANCNLTDNLTLRTRPLCALSYGDKESWSSKWYARPVTLRNPALI